MNWKNSRPTIVFLVALLATPLAFATAKPVEQAQTMMASGDLDGALRVLDSYLKTAPQDADGRFTKGLVLTRLKKTDAAIKIFTGLTRDYPQLPEPYNNLAVLYAQEGQYEKAREALQAALATHPSYATAAENLGDVYAAMAGQAYNRALKIDRNNQQIRYKLSLINRLNAPAGSSTQETTAPPPATAPAETAAATPPPPSPAAEAAPPEEQPAAETAAEPASPATAPDARERAAVIAAVESWADAWSRQNAHDYLSHYAPDFADGGLDHKAWAAQRRERLRSPKHVSVKLSGIEISSLGAHRVRVGFLQDYESDLFSDRVHKTLELSDATGHGWKIVSEKTD